MKLQTTTDFQLTGSAAKAFDDAIDSMDPVTHSIIDEISQPMSVEAFEDRVSELMDHMGEAGHKECPHEYSHQFPDGIYYRQVTKPACEIVIGAKHRTNHQNILLSGTQILFTHEGAVLMQAPFAFIGEAEGRKVTLTVTPVVFANVFKNLDNCDDIVKLQERLTYPDSKKLEHTLEVEA